ncbi:MAG: cupin domain-containing protein [Alphaproteobacteria bacterium]
MRRAALHAATLGFAMFAAPHLAAAQQTPVSTTQVLREDLGGLLGQETIMLVATIQPGGTIAWHTHPYGHEISYVVAGSLTLEIDGQNPRTLKPGDGFHIQPGTPHSVKNETGDTAQIVVVRITAKNLPIAVPFAR